MLLYWSDNLWRYSNTQSLPPTVTVTLAHYKYFLHSKFNSCTHISLPTLHIYLLYSHITSYTPHLTRVLTYHLLHSKSNSCIHISLRTLQIYLLYSHITSYTPNLSPVLTYHFLNSKSNSCTHI
jgi:uncharacterized membrane protein (DUF485 family)